LGCIEPGKLANIVLLTANPLEDIRHTQAIELILREGRICRPAELLKQLSEKWREFLYQAAVRGTLAAS